ncbi:sensor histidine kinase [Corynebacterium sphenisci]|uniref:sensor histidine kinase n=1 Tax=Corynebacterium sphenisci TaxID=191493 RepID=UPI0026DF9415|nr:sensor histidine kinase [Corynebacterium sphenisci]MDO5730283.1 sensor histidine kinase [Corynebacterium sphenisci]
MDRPAPTPDRPAHPGAGPAVAAEAAPAADPGALARAWRGLRIALDLLVAALLVLAVVADHRPIALAWAALFTAVYLPGTLRGRRAERRAAARAGAPAPPAGGHPAGPVLIWLLALLAAWAGLAFTVPEAAYLAFPLFFVAMHVASPAPGLVAVAGLTALAVAAIAHHGGPSPGGVIGPVVGGLVAAATGLGFRLLQREVAARQAALAQLLAARADVAAISRRAGELDERARLAAEIHDTVAQGLASIGLLLHAAEAELAQLPGADRPLDRIRLARGTAADNLAETRAIIARLQPAPLAGAELPAALARACAGTALGDAVSFRVDGPARPLPPDTEATVLRVAQTLLGNVVAHSGARSCRVTLTYEPEGVALDVVDDGVGFDPTAPAPGGSFGLAGARRRARDAAGDLTVESAPGAGCGVRLTLPAPAAPEVAAR